MVIGYSLQAAAISLRPRSEETAVCSTGTEERTELGRFAFISLRVALQNAIVEATPLSQQDHLSFCCCPSPFLSLGGPVGFSVDEENDDDSELDDAAIDATPTPDDGSDLDDVVIDLPPAPSAEPEPTAASTEGAGAAVPPSEPGGLRRSSSVATGLRANAPVLAMTTSPALVGLNRRQGHDTVVVTHAEVELSAATALAQAASAEEFAAERWGDTSNSPPARLSRSLSSSHASGGPTGWGPATAAAGAGVGAGCAKVTRSSHRRRSRANSTSSPLPMLEMSASMPAGGMGFADTTVAAADWTTRSYGSAGFPRHARRVSHGGGIVGGGGGGGIADGHLRRFSSCGGGGGSGTVDSILRRDSTREVRGSAPLARSHRMPLWGPGSGSSGLKSVGRPTSLPSGSMQRGVIRGGEGGLPAADASPPGGGGGGGDGGFGWVLRSPGAPLDHRRRSQSFAGGRSSLARAKPDSNPKFSSSSGVRERPLLAAAATGDGGFGEAYGLPGAWAERSSDGQDGAMLGDDDQDEDMASSAQTPQASPSRQGTSAALHRAHGLSSMARRMDRLEIRSPNVETHAAQVLLCPTAVLPCRYTESACGGWRFVRVNIYILHSIHTK